MPDGWLGIVLGSKIFINFTKYAFDECIRRLKAEIIAVSGVKGSMTPAKPPPTPSSHIERSSPLPVISIQNDYKKWTEADVKIWLDKNNACQDIKNFFKNFNGEMLFQTFLLKKEAPEYFYKAISQDYKVPFDEIIKFTLKLDSVFS
jgi:hypothetical protein